MELSLPDPHRVYLVAAAIETSGAHHSNTKLTCLPLQKLSFSAFGEVWVKDIAFDCLKHLRICSISSEKTGKS